MNELNLSWFKANAGAFSGQLLFDEPLAKHTWYRVGGPATLLATPRTRVDLEWLRQGLEQSGLPLFILGMGSNLLVSEAGFPGLVVKAGRLNIEIKTKGEDAKWVSTGSGLPVSSFLRRAAIEGWGGLEFLTGIPGSIGGAVFMNAGTHLGDTNSQLRAVEYFDLGAKSDTEAWVHVERESLRYQYRKNLFLPETALIWAADWEVRRDMPARVKSLIDETLARRKATQPIDLPSCGSVFKNPIESGFSAWQVIDKLKLRGHRIGGAEFSPKHCNFIINLGEARADDIYALIQLAKARALDEFQITLEEEVRYVGKFHN